MRSPGDEPLLAFYFCASAFSDAVAAGLLDVALGYCNDCALISENHALPDAVAPFAQIGLMRAAAHVEDADYGAALDALDAVIEATHYVPTCGSAFFRATFARPKRPSRPLLGRGPPKSLAKVTRVALVRRPDVFAFPNDDHDLKAFTARAARGPGLSTWRLGYTADALKRTVAKARTQAQTQRRVLRSRFAPILAVAGR